MCDHHRTLCYSLKQTWNFERFVIAGNIHHNAAQETDVVHDTKDRVGTEVRNRSVPCTDGYANN